MGPPARHGCLPLGVPRDPHTGVGSAAGNGASGAQAWGNPLGVLDGLGGGGRAFPEARGRGQDPSFTTDHFQAFLCFAREVNTPPLKRSQPSGARELLSRVPKHRRSSDLLVLEPASPCAAPLVHACPARIPDRASVSMITHQEVPNSLGGCPVPVPLFLSSSLLECPRCREGIIGFTAEKTSQIPSWERKT